MSDQKPQMSNLALRIIIGVIGGGLVVGGIVADQWSMLSILLIIGTISLIEFYQLFIKNTEYKPNLILGVTTWLICFIVPFLNGIIILDQDLTIIIVGATFILFPIILLIAELYRKKSKPIQNVAITVFGMLYIAIPLFSLAMMGLLFDRVYHYELILTTFLLLWASDSGAYFAGKAFGKTPLFPRISPKKTWEGSIGGLALAIITGIVISQLNNYAPAIPEMCGLALIIVVFGGLGDLCESMFKRSIDIKDSGSILPGHGGFLDRFDGLFVAAPFALIYLICIS